MRFNYEAAINNVPQLLILKYNPLNEGIHSIKHRRNCGEIGLSLRCGDNNLRFKVDTNYESLPIHSYLVLLTSYLIYSINIKVLQDFNF